MGQSQSAPYLQVLKHTLAVYGVHVSSSDIEMCIRVVREWNPWFPEEGSMDLENWRRVRCNVEKAWRQGEKIPIRFWSIWSVLYTLFQAMTEDRSIKNLRKEAAPSILDLQLDAEVKEAIKSDSIELTKKPVSKKGSQSESDSEVDGASTAASVSKVKAKKGKWHNKELEALLNKLTFLENKLGELSFPSKSQPSVPPLRELLKTPISDESEDSEVESAFAFPIIRPPPVQGVAQPPRYDGINMDDIADRKSVV